MRTFCKVGGTKNIPIQAIGLSLYEELGGATQEQIGKEVVRTQWLDFSTLGKTPLLGRRVLIVVSTGMLECPTRTVVLSCNSEGMRGRLQIDEYPNSSESC